MGSLVEVIKDASKRRQVIDDCATLIDGEVSDKGGLSGLAIKAAYASVKGLRPGMIPMAMDGLLDDFSSKVEPYWQKCQAEGANPRVYFTQRKGEIANALLGITDARAQKTPHKVLKSAYEKLRPQAVDHIGSAMPRLADLIQKHAS